jgi:predicted ribosome-associated RNA-binding protein Tma20
MKLQMLKSVVDGNRILKKNTIVEVKNDTARQFLAVGIAIEHKEPIVKEDKQEVETKEHKAPRKRRTKNK